MKPKSSFTQRQDCVNSILIEDLDGNSVCNVLSEWDEITPEHRRIARLIEMSPTMKNLLISITVANSNFVNEKIRAQAKRILNYINEDV